MIETLIEIAAAIINGPDYGPHVVTADFITPTLLAVGAGLASTAVSTTLALTRDDPEAPEVPKRSDEAIQKAARAERRRRAAARGQSSTILGATREANEAGILARKTLLGQ